MTIDQMPPRVGWSSGSGWEESRLRRWASAAFPLVCAFFVLSFPTLGNIAIEKGSGAFPGESTAMALVAAGIFVIVLLGTVATPASERVFGLFKRDDGSTARERPTGAAPLDLVRSVSASAATVADIFEVRSALFVFVAGLAARNARDHDIEDLADLVDGLIARRLGADGTEFLIDHRLAEICGNAAAREMFAHCERRLQWFEFGSFGMTAADGRRTVLDWRGLIEALRSRDPMTAETIARRMARQSRLRLAVALEGD